MRFEKYHGTGNDFVMVEDLADEISLTPQLIAALCDRHRGVGADGLIRIAPTSNGDFFMDYYNADGDVAEMCGNGIRCLAKYVFDHGLSTATEIDVSTRAGPKRVVLELAGGSVRDVTVDMGRPSFERKLIPMTGDPESRFVEETLEVDGRAFRATAVSMGNPHCVLFLDAGDDLTSFDVRAIGRRTEHRPEFPNRTNVEFVQVRDGRIVVRVWERGSGETMACGTGACAALVASAASGRTERSAGVEFPGGVLEVTWGEDDHVVLSGSAVRVFEGRLDDKWVSRFREAALR